MKPSGFRTHIDILIRFRDTDAMGHVNNAVYLSYLEMARWRYWHELTGLRRPEEVDFIVARVEIDYRSPSTVGEKLRVWVRVPEISRSSFVCVYRIEEPESGRLVAEARTVQACFDYGKNKVKRIAPEIRRRIVELEGLEQGTAKRP